MGSGRSCLSGRTQMSHQIPEKPLHRSQRRSPPPRAVTGSVMVCPGRGQTAAHPSVLYEGYSGLGFPTHSPVSLDRAGLSWVDTWGGVGAVSLVCHHCPPLFTAAQLYHHCPPVTILSSTVHYYPSLFITTCHCPSSSTTAQLLLTNDHHCPPPLCSQAETLSCPWHPQLAPHPKSWERQLL